MNSKRPGLPFSLIIPKLREGYSLSMKRQTSSTRSQGPDEARLNRKMVPMKLEKFDYMSSTGRDTFFKPYYDHHRIILRRTIDKCFVVVQC